MMGRIAHLNDEDFDDDDIEYAGEEWAGTVLFWMILAGLWEFIKIFGTLFLVAGFLVLCGFKPLLTLYSYVGPPFVTSVPSLLEFFVTSLLLFLGTFFAWSYIKEKGHISSVVLLVVPLFLVFCGFQPLFTLFNGIGLNLFIFADAPAVVEFAATLVLFSSCLLFIDSYIQKRMY